ncbi:MAG TPA: hypothetical protein VJN43_07250 [Bryobacteraceae bacterium]|nr:hypothetical protein [Bryobacteraceae bacterium]
MKLIFFVLMLITSAAGKTLADGSDQPLAGQNDSQVSTADATDPAPDATGPGKSTDAAANSVAPAGQNSSEIKRPAAPVVVHVGLLTLRPTAFFDVAGVTRSDMTMDSMNTKLGKIPLADTPSGSQGTLRTSRMHLTGTIPFGEAKLTGYMESDFMNFTANQNMYRWRQYWGRLDYGSWELLGGQAWSLLRPNRAGMSTEKDMMHTDLIDSGYQVGLLGSRTKQLRIVHAMGDYHAGVAWESDGNMLGKVTHDAARLHLEATGLAGRFARKGVTAAGVYSVTPRFRVVSQEYWSNRAIYQALNLAPAGINGYSTIEGVEAQVRKNFEVYSYGGVVYASRSKNNRVVREWTVGFNQKVNTPSLLGNMLMSFQYSHADRELWTGKAGVMDFVMYRVRYTFN